MPFTIIQTYLKAIWTRCARMSWASSVMRLRSLSCLMKLSSSEALAIQKARAPAMFFCFCNVQHTHTHSRFSEQQDAGDTEELKEGARQKEFMFEWQSKAAVTSGIDSCLAHPSLPLNQAGVEKKSGHRCPKVLCSLNQR